MMIPFPTPQDALFLDLDGTLLEFAPTPAEVVVPEGLDRLLHDLAAQRGGALALLSGRTLADIDKVTGRPFAAGAEHGYALRDNEGAVHHPVRESANRQAWREALEAMAAAHPGAWVEPKASTLVAHFRRAPAAGGELRRLIDELVGGAPEVEVLPAHMAWEIRPRGVDKGHALRWFMAQPPFAGRRPVFVGDDTTDEAAIEAANQLGGRGLHVHRDFDGTPGSVLAWLKAAREGAKG